MARQNASILAREVYTSNHGCAGKDFRSRQPVKKQQDRAEHSFRVRAQEYVARQNDGVFLPDSLQPAGPICSVWFSQRAKNGHRFVDTVREVRIRQDKQRHLQSASG
jgi:hypothetical protein